MRQPARLITIVWGDRYFEQLRDLTLPAILAPGNLPALVNDFDCTLVIVTETRLYDAIRRAEPIRRIERYCPVRLVPLDDLIEGAVGYGLALTYALHRGFDDLGERMCDTFLIFFNADFIVADGSFASLAKRMAAGERLIFSPSYCVVAEDAIPILATRIVPQTGALVVSKREMAAIGLDNLHNTVLAKTINRQYFQMHVSDQLYWRVDRTTLLGHQLPIAIVCMRPERVYIDPICFWDYATISMACPTAHRCVLGDSDDFLMIELRQRDTFRELMRPGVPTPEDVGKALGAYMTPDQLEMGHYPLTLHAGDLPPGTEAARAKLKAYLDRVYAALPKEPVSPVNHRFWVGQAEHYSAQREQYRDNLTSIDYRILLVEESQKTPAAAGCGPWPGIEVNLAGRAPAAGTARRLFGRQFGFVPAVTALHPLHGLYRFVAERVDRALAGKRRPNTLFVAREESPIERLVSQRPGTFTRGKPLALFQSNIPAEAGEFDLCLCDLDWVEANEFLRLYRLILPRMKPDGAFVMFHTSRVIRNLEPVGAVMGLRPLVPDDRRAIFYFSGGADVSAAVDQFRYWLADHEAKPDFPHLALRKILRDARKNRRINLADRKRSPHDLALPCIAFTMEIPLAEDRG